MRLASAKFKLPVKALNKPVKLSGIPSLDLSGLKHVQEFSAKEESWYHYSQKLEGNVTALRQQVEHLENRLNTVAE